MRSKEALEDMISWMVDEQVEHFKEQLETIKQGLERLEMLKKAIEILKNNVFIEFNDDNQFISLKEDKYQYADYTIIFIENKQEYKLLKKVLVND